MIQKYLKENYTKFTSYVKGGTSFLMNTLRDPSFQSKMITVGLNVGIFCVCVTSLVLAGDDTSATTTSKGLVMNTNLWNNVTNFVNDIYGKMVILDSTAAGAGVGTGALMLKFSNGKEQKIDIGKKCISYSIGSWIVLNSIGGILGYANSFIK